MGKHIDLRVQFRGQERLLRLMDVDGEWHAALLVPGKEDLLLQRYVVPSPPGTMLPGMWLNDATLFIEPPSDNVMNIEMGRLLASGRIAYKGGWIAVEVDSIRADYHDDIGGTRGKTSLAELHGKEGRPKVRDSARDMER
jgi:hypothetical protein